MVYPRLVIIQLLALDIPSVVKLVKNDASEAPSVVRVVQNEALETPSVVRFVKNATSEAPSAGAWGPRPQLIN